MDRRAALAEARLYLVTAAIDEARLSAALLGGVDIVQLRIKNAGDEELLAHAAVVRRCCTAARALFILNDRPDLAAAAQADGVHVGQDDTSVAEARAIVGEDAIVGLSTHSPEQVDATVADLLAKGTMICTFTSKLIHTSTNALLIPNSLMFDVTVTMHITNDMKANRNFRA